MNQLAASAPSITRRRRRRVAVLGWRAGTRALVEALTEHGRTTTVAIGDTRAFALVKARGAIHASCFQHVLEMVRLVEYEFLLIGDDTYGAQGAEVAARRGATILVDAARLSAPTLEATANIALRHDVPFVLLRPGLPLDALDQISEHLASRDLSQPGFVNVDIEDDRPAIESLRDAVAALLALSPARPLSVVAAASGDPEDPDAVNVQVRTEGGAIASLTARVSDEPRIRLSLRSGAEGAEADIRTAVGSVSLGSAKAARTSFLPASDALALEAARTRRPSDHSAHDVRTALREAALLLAIESAIESGEIEPVAEPASGLRLLRGGGVPTEAAAPRLSLVGR